jgi:geranylgeranyl diphosphate synthase, type I
VLEQMMKRYFARLDATLRETVDAAPVETPDYGVMLRYPLGWVDANNQPYHQPAGKRIRPTLLLLCAEAAGGNWENALPAAAAVELLHNFSLVHDDIQDNSPMRHGRPTLWKVWGAANGINAGDALFALAYIALTRLSEHGIEPQIMVDCWRVFNSTVLELTRGQHLDMRFEHQLNVSVNEYISMISGKTAALVACCAEIGALIGSSNHELASRYASFGLNLGIAFQIRDDILGIWGDAEVTGKSVATDIVSHKKSLPVLYGLEKNPELVELYRKETFEEPDVEQAVALLNSVNALEFTRQQEAKFYERAIASLHEANPQGEAALALNVLIDRLFQRVS